MKTSDAILLVKKNHDARRVRTTEAERCLKINRLDAVADMQREMDSLFVECAAIKSDFGLKQNHAAAINVKNPQRMLAMAQWQAENLEPNVVLARIDAAIATHSQRLSHLRTLPLTPEVSRQILQWTEHIARLQQHREGIARG